MLKTGEIYNKHQVWNTDIFVILHMKYLKKLVCKRKPIGNPQADTEFKNLKIRITSKISKGERMDRVESELLMIAVILSMSGVSSFPIITQCGGILIEIIGGY